MTSAADQGSPKPVLLFVEDHADSRTMYAEYLGDRFEVIEAEDGVGGWEILQQRPVDVVVTDLSLPALDGYELIRRIRHDARLQDLPIVAMSGYSAGQLESDVQWDLVLEKPCMPDDVADAVAAAMSSRRNR